MFESRWLGMWLAVAVLSTGARGGVIVVNASGGGDYTSIASAVAAAQDGDTLLVKAGSYGGFSLSGKSLSIVADTGAVVSVQDGVTVSNPSATQTVVFGGLRIQSSSSWSPALHVNTNQGAFRAHGCTFVGLNNSGTYQSHGAQLEAFFGSPPAVAFVDCYFRGGDMGWSAGADGESGAHALFAGSSKVALYDCTLVGGAAVNGSTWSGGDGGSGAYFYNAGGFLHASGSSFQGGQGGDVCMFGQPLSGGWGGAGVYLWNGAVSWFVESSSAGGAPGVDCHGFFGQPGPAVGGSGNHFVFPVGKLEMEAPWLVREGNQVLLTIRGEPRAKVYLESSPATQFVGAASWRGVDLVKETRFSEPILFLGKIPGSGVMTVGLPIPLLPQRIKANTLFLQVRGWGSNGLVIGSFAALTVLDSAY